MAQNLADEIRAFKRGDAPAKSTADEIRAFKQTGSVEASEDEVTAGGVALELAKTIPRGVAAMGEMVGDVADLALETRVPAGFAPGLPGLESTPDDARTWAARNVVNPFTEESAGDRLRRAASEATGLRRITERTLPPTGSPALEGLFAGGEIAGSTLATGGLGAIPSALRGGAQAVARWAAPRLPAAIGGIFGGGTGRAVAEAGDFGPLGTAVTEVIGEIMGGASPRSGRAIANALREVARAYRGGKAAGTSMADARLNQVALAAVEDALVGEATPEEAAEIMARLRQRVAAGEQSTMATMAESPEAEGLTTLAAARIKGATDQWRARDQATRAQAREAVAAAVPEGDPVAAAQVQRAAERADLRRLREAAGRRTAAAEATEADALARLEAEEAAALRAAEAAEATQRAPAERIRKAARGRAAARREEIGTAQPLEQSGAARMEEIEAGREAARAAEDKAWAAVPRGVMVSTRPFKRRVQAVLRGMQLPERRQFRAQLGPYLDEIMEMPEKVRGEYLTSFERVMRDATPVSEGFDPNRFSAMKDNITTAIRKTLKENEDLGPEFKRASQKSFERFQTFQEGPVGALRRQVNRSQVSADVVNRIVRSGPGGGDVARAAARAGADVPAALRSKFLAEASDNTGELTAAKAQAFMKKYAAALDTAREVRAELHDVTRALQVEDEAEALYKATATEAGRLRAAAERTAARERGAGTTAAAAERKAAVSGATRLRRAGEKVVRGRPSLRGTTPGDVVGEASQVLSGARPAGRIRSMMRTARAAGGQAVRDLQAAFSQAFIRDMVSEGGKGKGIPDEALARLERYREPLSEVLSPEQLERMAVALEPTGRIRQGAVIPGEFPEAGSGLRARLQNMFARMGVAGAASMSGANSLIVSNMAASSVDNYMKKIPQAKINNLIFNYLMYPEKFLEAMDTLGSSRIAPEQVIGILDELMVPATAATTRFQEEE